MGVAALYRRLCGFNPCGVCAVLVHFLLWQAAKPSGDKCTPYK